jgi:hypothetical protein
VQDVAEGTERDADLVAAPLQLAVGPLEEAVGDDAVDHEEHAEAEQGRGEGLAPGHAGARLALFARPDDRADQDQGDNNGCVERSHLEAVSLGL